ncbi:N-acetylmuramic acid 6-phosphate etherase [Vibrio profundum]|uniref:N-acetylmuramic acid 6-phosphate etherase n=1 Tax=Vibrio profundum TaxID=2910247 RepID=UPI003D0FD2C1
MDLTKLTTEQRNPASEKIDTLSTIDMLRVINQEDQKVATAIERVLPEISQAVDLITHAFAHGGRLVYLGAGTSGRLGVLDASECPPTFGSDPEQVVGLIAGGHPALLKAVENAEDKSELGAQDLQSIQFSDHDILVAIAASGRTPYAIGAMEYARSLNAQVICVTCNPNSPMANFANVAITPIVGPEVVTGSSRMKAGTAQKLVLNMLTTGTMIQSGKVFGNLMVDVEATNAKLIERQKQIVMSAADCTHQQAEFTLKQCGNHCKTAIVMLLTHCSPEQARKSLSDHNGKIRQALS